MQKKETGRYISMVVYYGFITVVIKYIILKMISCCFVFATAEWRIHRYVACRVVLLRGRGNFIVITVNW